LIHKNLLNPEILSRLIFDEREKGVFYVQGVPHYDFRRAGPEEIIRQLCALSLIHHYHYPEQDIILEYNVQMGSTKKRADIVILDNQLNPYIVVEVKKSDIDEETRAQLNSYLTITKAAFGVAVSRHDSFCISNNGVLQSDIPLYKGNGVPILDPLPASDYFTRSVLQVENFERSSRASAKITIKGHTLKLSNIDLSEIKKLRARFLEAGVVIADIPQREWSRIFERLMDNSPPSAILVEMSTIKPLTKVELMVSELLESSNNPFFGPEMVLFRALFDTLVRQSNGIIKKDEMHKLTSALLGLGFIKLLDRQRIPGFEINGDNRTPIWGKNPVNNARAWALSVIESRKANLDYKEPEISRNIDLSKTAIFLIDYCSTEGRICPNSENWQKLWQMLPEDIHKVGPEQKAPEPLTIPILYSENWEKQKTLKEQIVWADVHGVIAKVDQFLRHLSQDEWERSI